MDHGARVALLDDRGRFLCATGPGRVLRCLTGELAAAGIISVVTAANTKRHHLLLSGSHVCWDPATLTYCANAGPATAASLQLRAEDHCTVQILDSSAPGTSGTSEVRALYAGHDGLVSARPEGTVFTVVPRPFVGLLSVPWALERQHGRPVCLWAMGPGGSATADSGGSPLAGRPLPQGGGWVTAHLRNLFGFGGHLTGRAQRLNRWECWALAVVDPEAGAVTLTSNHGFFLCAEPSGKLAADRKEASHWERFTLTQAEGGAVVLRSAHGGYVSARAEQLDACARDIGAAEMFLLLDGTTAMQAYLEKGLLA